MSSDSDDAKQVSQATQSSYVSGQAPPPAASRRAWSGRSASLTIRVLALLFAAIPLSGLFVARQLQPSSTGIGTHQQLGLPPCSMRMLFGMTCPGCGMTTSWAHFTRGQWTASAATNLGGFLFALYAIWIAFLALRSVFTGRLPGSQTQQVLALSGAGIFAVALMQWVLRLLGWGL